MYLNWKERSLLLHLCSSTWLISLPSILAFETTPHNFRQNLAIGGVKHDPSCSATNHEEMTLDDLIMSSRGTFSIRSRDCQVESSHITSELGPRKSKPTWQITNFTKLKFVFGGQGRSKEVENSERCETKRESCERLKAITKKAQRWADSVKVLSLEHRFENFEAPLKEAIKLLVKLFYLKRSELHQHQLVAFDQANQKIGKFLFELLTKLSDFFDHSFRNEISQDMRSERYLLAELVLSILSLVYDQEVIHWYHLLELFKEGEGRMVLEKCFPTYFQSKPLLNNLEKSSNFNLPVSLLKNKNSEGFLNLIGYLDEAAIKNIELNFINFDKKQCHLPPDDSLELKRHEEAFSGIEFCHLVGETLQKEKQMDLFVKYYESYIENLPVQNLQNSYKLNMDKYKLLYDNITYVLKYHDDDSNSNYKIFASNKVIFNNLKLIEEALGLVSSLNHSLSTRIQPMLSISEKNGFQSNLKGVLRHLNIYNPEDSSPNQTNSLISSFYFFNKSFEISNQQDEQEDLEIFVNMIKASEKLEKSEREMIELTNKEIIYNYQRYLRQSKINLEEFESFSKPVQLVGELNRIIEGEFSRISFLEESFEKNFPTKVEN